MSKSTCKMADCGREVHYRGICRKHYDLEGGYKQVRPRVDITCIDCGNTHKVQKRLAPTTPRCPPCARSHGWANRERKAPTPTYPSSRVHPGLTCTHCSKMFTSRRAGLKYCTKECRYEASMVNLGCRNRECKKCGAPLGYKSLAHQCETCSKAMRAARRRIDRKARDGNDNHRSRARRNGVPYEPIKHIKVFERDGWTCGICQRPINPGLKYPHYSSPSLDHILPLSKGGGHVYGNVQASHWICNTLKGADA